MSKNSIHGILLIDKPPGLTSNGVLQRVKRLFNAKKAGHTGSLDPIATGMLPICFGEATKFSQFLLDANKTYHVVAKLGAHTTTGDREGDIIATQEVPPLNEVMLEKIFQTFIGTIEQIPPMFSALKYQGKPLYQLARQGIEVERKARTITIFSLQLRSLQKDTIEFSVHCSKGTYVRTLVEDIGKQLGCGAHVQELRRVTVTPYESHSMYSLEFLENNSFALQNLLLPVETAVHSFPALQLSKSTAYYLRLGQQVRVPNVFHGEMNLIRLVAEDVGFFGMGEILSDGSVKPHRLIMI